MIFTAEKHAKLIEKVELIGLNGRREITDDTVQAGMHEVPGVWACGWADMLVCHKGTGRPITRMKIGADNKPLTRRHYGLIQWFKK